MNPSVTGARYEVGEQRRGMDVFVSEHFAQMLRFSQDSQPASHRQQLIDRLIAEVSWPRQSHVLPRQRWPHARLEPNRRPVKAEEQAAATTATTAAHLVYRMPTSSASEDLGPLYIYRCCVVIRRDFLYST